MPQNITVAEGVCFSSLAAKAGFGTHTPVYQDGANSELRKSRPNPNMLVPGDAVTVPDPRAKEIAVPTDSEHKFVVKLLQVKLRITILDVDDKPVGGKPYRLLINGEKIDGTLPKNGRIEHVIAPDVTSAELTIDPDAPPPAEPAPPAAAAPPPASPDPPPYPAPIDVAAYKDKIDPAYVGTKLRPVSFSLAIGSLPSHNEVIGVQARLTNLGFDCRGEWGAAKEGTTAAVKAYQHKYGGGDSGVPADIQDAIRDRHDKVA